ncbi:hypothetical protein KJ877_09920 [bacterium]|nr:hypothetical protein [bacterium]MBU1991249.1 hypothetical protein [bacterium]
MKIAVPLDDNLLFYRNNPYTAPKFGIYTIDIKNAQVSFGISDIVDNPKYTHKSIRFNECQMRCECDFSAKKDINHICEHYALLETIGECSYLLADKFCDNTLNSLKNGGVKVFKIPTIINKTETAIKNFLIGASFANKIQNIHYAS